MLGAEAGEGAEIAERAETVETAVFAEVVEAEEGAVCADCVGIGDSEVWSFLPTSRCSPGVTPWSWSKTASPVPAMIERTPRDPVAIHTLRDILPPMPQIFIHT